MTHIVYTSIAARLTAGEYSPHVARRRGNGPTRPVAASVRYPWAAVLPYVGSGILGGLMGYMLAGGLS
jgi:hypothetical protein